MNQGTKEVPKVRSRLAGQDVAYEMRVVACARCLEFYQRDVTDECCHRGTSCRVVSKRFQEMVKVALKPENVAQPVFGLSFHSFAWRTSTTMRRGGLY